MTFLLNAKYAADAPSPNYPVRGSIKNDSSPGAKDGTALDNQWKDDERAIWEILLQNANITPSGNVDTALASDLHDAFLFAISKTYSTLREYPVNKRTIGSDGNEYKSLIANGPSSLVVDPVGDITGTWGNNWMEMHAQDQKALGVDGGGYTAGARVTRDIAVIKNTIPGASIILNKITAIPIGTWKIKGSVPGFETNLFKAWLHNLTTVNDDIIGTSEKTGGAQQTSTRSLLDKEITTLASTDFEIQQQCTSTGAIDGLGVASGFDIEIYTDITIQRSDG